MSLLLLPSLFTFFLLLLLVPATSSNDASSAYELLAGYNFPIGLLPKGVTGYELDRASGKFRAYLNGSCAFSLEGSYDIRYKSTISGYISQNRLTGLSGISVKVLFLWLNIVEVVRDGDEIDFSVGIASAAFPIENFFECPQCGCGLDCDAYNNNNNNNNNKVLKGNKVNKATRSSLLIFSS